MRLAKYLAHCGVASRRAATEIVRAGRVTVAGEVVTDPARDVDEGSGVALDGEPLAPESRVVYALHKPAGVVSTARDTHGRRTVVDLIDEPGDRRVYPVGRLDADTTGLMLLTNDGELAELLTHPRHGVPKTYIARVDNPPVRAKAVRALLDGVQLDDGPATAQTARRLGRDGIELTIAQGRKRQVRRMCAAVGHPAVALARIRFGTLALEGLAEGAHRRLSDAEVADLRAAAGQPARRSARRARQACGSGRRG